MKESISKLINLLNTTRFKVLISDILTIDEIKTTIDELDYFLDIFKHIDDKPDKNKKIIIFEEFPMLCSFLEEYSKIEEIEFSATEKYEIIMSVIKRNINTGFLNSQIVNVNNELTDYENLKQKALSVLKSHKSINDNYFEKKDYDKIDIRIIEESLINLGVNINITSIIKNILTIDYNKREYKNNKNKSKFNMEAKGIYSLDDYYKKQNEKKQLIKELNKYFDYDHMEAKRPLTMDEKLYCLNLLDKIGLEKEGQIKFLKLFENYQVEYDNPLAIIANNYEKLKYYEEKYGLQKYVNTLTDYLEFTFICDYTEYQGWKKEIEKELDEVMKELPKNYEYELSKIKRK